LTPEEHKDLKVAARRYKQAVAQQQYHLKMALAAGRSYGVRGRPKTGSTPTNDPHVLEKLALAGKNHNIAPAPMKSLPPASRPPRLSAATGFTTKAPAATDQLVVMIKQEKKNDANHRRSGRHA
jgi:hypothetical protein